MLFQRKVFHTALSSLECEQRLRAAMDPDGAFPGLAKTLTKPVLGRIAHGRFHLRRCELTNNAFVPVLRGRFEPAVSGSRVTYAFGFRRSVELFTLFLTMFALVGVIMSKSPFGLPVAFFAPALMAVSWHLDRGDRTFLVDYLRRTLS